MNHLEQIDKKTLGEKFKSLAVPTKLYLIFNVLALALAAISGGLFAVIEANALSGLAKAVLVFSVLYILITSLVVNLSSTYNRERNIIAALTPLIMTTIGLVLSFWLYDEYLSDQIGIITIALTAVTLVIVPIIGFSLSRALTIKTGKLYTLCFWQIIITALIAWLEFTLFI